MRRIIIACALVGVLGVPAFGQGVDPYIGTWKLNLEKTTYIGQPPPKSMTITFTGDGHTLTGTIDVIGPEVGRSNSHIR